MQRIKNIMKEHVEKKLSKEQIHKNNLRINGVST